MNKTYRKDLGQLRVFIQKIGRIFMTLALITAIIFPNLISADSAESVNTIGSTQTWGKIYVSKQAYFEIETVNILPSQEEGSNVIFTVSLHNGENHALAMEDYWIYMLAGANSQIPIYRIAKDKNKNRVSPNTTEQFTYYSAAKESLTFKDISFKFIQWDIQASDFQRLLGSLKAPTQLPDGVLTNSGSKLITISGSSVLTSVYQAQLSSNENNTETIVNFQLENKGNLPVTIPDYQFFVQTPEGNYYKMIKQDMSSITLSPLSKKKLMLYTEMPVLLKTLNWKLIVTQFDLNSKLFMPVAQYGFSPTKLEDLTGSSNDSQIVEIADDLLKTNITNVLTNRNNESELLAITYQIENEGNRPIKMPKLSFSIRTKEGLYYPASIGNMDSMSISPHESKEVILSASLPLDIGLEGLKLILNHPEILDNKSEFPMAIYSIPSIDNAKVYSGVETGFSIQKRAFSAILNGMNRYPWEDEDVLVADVSITNKGNETVAMPSFAGYFLLDGKVKMEANVMVVDKNVTLKENAGSHLMLITKVPYSSEFSNIQLVILNKDNEKETKLAEFNNAAEFLEIPLVAEGEAAKFTDKGRKASLKVYAAKTYEGLVNHLLYVEFELKNEEKRMSTPASFVAYFKTKDDLYFPLKVTTINQQISPNGKVLLTCWASMSKVYQLKDLELVLGEGIAGNLFVSEDSKADAMVKVVKFKLPSDQNTYQNHLSNVAFYPYSLSLSNIIATTGNLTNTMDINFNYQLTKNVTDVYENQISGHKLVFEFVNGSSDTKFSTEVSFELDTGNSLQVGNHSTTITFSDPNLLKYLNRMDSYTIQLYDQYQGNKKLIATKGLRWFQTSD